MRNNSKGKILYGFIGTLGLAVAVIPLAVYRFIETAGAHGHGMAMKMACETACVAAAVIGAVIAAVAIVSLLLKDAKLKTTGSVVLLAGGAAAIFVPRSFGLCAAADMACRYLTSPTLALLGSAIIVLSIVRLTADIISIRKESVTA